MRNTLNKLRLILITSICLIIAACSSGGSGSTEGLNISGRWVGTLTQSEGYVYDVVFDFAQVDTVGVPGNDRQSQVTFSFSVASLADSIGGGQDYCTGATLSGGTLTISSEANPATLFGDGFNAVVIDNRISGQTVIDDFDSITIVVGTDEDGNEITEEIECAFGGPIELRRSGT